MINTLLIQNCNNSSKKICPPKLLLCCSMRKLHNNLLLKFSSSLTDAYDNNRKSIISDTTLRALLTSNVKKLTDKYKEKCGCKVYTLAKGNQKT